MAKILTEPMKIKGQYVADLARQLALVVDNKHKNETWPASFGPGC